MQQAMYPVQFSVDYPDRPLDRLTTIFRLFMVIPIAIVLGAVAGGTWQWTSGSTTAAVASGAGGLLFFGPLLMILFRQKYPPVVVRLEPRAAAVRQPGGRLPGPDGRSVPVHH